MKDGFLRVAAATPDVKVSDWKYNTDKIIEMIFKLEKQNVAIVVFPELSITSYTCGDLFLRSDLIKNAVRCLVEIKDKTKNLDIVSIIGLPIYDGRNLYNCAAVLYHGVILGIVPKKNIPNYSEFYEKRYFADGVAFKEILINNEKVPFGTDLIFACNEMSSFKFGIEICEDLWVASSPSLDITANGANIVFNLSASSESLGKSEYRKRLIESQSAKTLSAYVYASSGVGESSTDLVFSGHNLISELGTTLSESKKFSNGFIFADIDLEKIEFERRRTCTFNDSKKVFKIIDFDFQINELDLKRNFNKMPFVPNQDKMSLYCRDVISIQSHALAKRLQHIGCKKVVIGVSGGLDSTLALISTVHTFDVLNFDRTGIIAVTMPCFGTSSQTLKNAKRLAEAYGVEFRKIDIQKSVREHFKDIGHNENIHNLVYENSQARERTQILMDIANEENAIVIGTGDMSELALGFATYGGDHMSMYCLNSSVPKTLVRCVVWHEASVNKGQIKEILLDIIKTPISPELLPSQDTEKIVGPYELNDFFLYYFLRFGFSAKKIFRISKIAFKDVYLESEIEKCLRSFISKFFKQQFKRSCAPDGPKVSEIALSPRGDFRMASDVSFEGFVL